ncbi:MAG TPA: hypothetical protein VN461_01115 [Vicinamibacteria bacterium]|nr:hypothetical protein [Vicinamibacteria bacterium]
MALLLTVVASVLMGFRAGVSYPAPGVDASYALALNYAAVHNEHWGQEFISDRGPYGWLLYPVNVGDVARSWFLVQALFVVMVGLVAVAYAWSGPGSTAKRVLMGLLLTYTVHVAYWEEWRWFGLFLLLYLLALHRNDRAGLIALGLASALGGFFLLMKLTIGPAALLALGVGCLLPRRASAFLPRLLVASGCATFGLIVGWVGYYGSTSGLATYLAVSLSMAGGYSSAASLAIEGWQVAVASFLVFFLLLSAWAVYVGHRRAQLSLLSCAGPLFVAWKHSVVRQDVHGRVLVLFGLLIVAVLVTDSMAAERRWRAAPFLAAAVGSLVVAWFHLSVADGPPEHTLVNALAEPLRLPGVRGIGALAQFSQYRADLAQLSKRALEPLVVPPGERKALADSSVDVYPWEVGYVAANQLNWANRPSPASHSAHSAILDSMNAEFFDSPRRPQRLLWHKTSEYLLRTPGITSVASIDGRHLFWDEPLTLVSILNHYRLVSSGRVFVLEARAEPRFVSRRQVGTVTVPWGAWASVPDTPGVVLAQIRISRPLWAKVRGLLLREEEMSADIRFRARSKASGTWTAPEIHCRFIPDLVASGLWISPLPHNAANLEALLLGGLPEGARVEEIRFWNGWGQAAPDLRISWLALSADGPATPPVAD